MSQTLPIAPPPPPPIVQRCKKNEACEVQLMQQKHLLEECLWSMEYPELQKACYFARICLDRRPKTCQFKTVKSIVQVGPTCGLTALSMLLGGIPSVEHLLMEARQRHFSFNGEMFSALQLYDLVCDYLPTIDNNNDSLFNSSINDDNLQCQQNVNDTEIRKNKSKREQDSVSDNKTLDCKLHEGHLNCAKVRDALLQGACLFVPYPFQRNIVNSENISELFKYLSEC